MKIGVYGSADGQIKEEVYLKARELGREIARRRHVLVTGACPGLPQEAVLGAYELRGTCIGFSPARSRGEHIQRDKFPVKGFSKLIFVPGVYRHADEPLVCRKYRNIESVYFVDVGVIIGGRTGTMNEFTLLYDSGKNIGVLRGTGGIAERAINVLVQDIDKSRGSRIIYSDSHIVLLDELERLSIPDHNI